MSRPRSAPSSIRKAAAEATGRIPKARSIFEYLSAFALLYSVCYLPLYQRWYRQRHGQ